MLINKNEKGIGLIEVIAALGLAVVVITSLVSLSVFTLRSSTKGKLLLTGSKLANEQIELVRAYRDANTWSDFITAVQGCTDVDTDACHMCVGDECSPALPVRTLGVTNSHGYSDLNDGSSSQGTAQEVRFGFSAHDSSGGGVDASDDVVRIDVQVRWPVGADYSYTHIYTDISNWRDL